MTQRRTTPPGRAEAQESKMMRRLIGEIGREGPLTTCPEDARLAALAEGRLPKQEREDIFAHLAECDACLESYSLICALQEEEAMESKRDRPVWKPMALAASFALVILSLLLLDPRGRELAPEIQSPPISMPEPAPEPAFLTEKAREKKKEARIEEGGKPPSPGNGPETKAVIERKGAKDITSPRTEKKRGFSGRSHLKDEAPSIRNDKAPKQDKMREAEEEQLVGGLRKSSRETPMRTAAHPVAQRRKLTAIQLPTPPPGTAPVRLSVILVLGTDGTPVEIEVTPVDSSLADRIRRSLTKRRFTACPSTPGRFQFTADWDGREWRVQSCPSPGDKVSEP